MAYAPASVEPVLGEFVEKEIGNYFHWTKNGDFGHGPFTRFPHLVWVGDGQYRYAEVLKTVAYIVVDEDECGLPVVEKWEIKNRKEYDCGLRW